MGQIVANSQRTNNVKYDGYFVQTVTRRNQSLTEALVPQVYSSSQRPRSGVQTLTQSNSSCGKAASDRVPMSLLK